MDRQSKKMLENLKDAISTSDFEMMEKILSEDPSVADELMKDNFLVLYAVKLNNIEMLQLLFKYLDLDSNEALRIAINSRNFDAIECCIQNIAVA